MKALLLFSILFPTIIFANLHNAPPDFSIEGERGANAIFIDFKKVTYKIEYDLKRKTAKAHTEIIFMANKVGHPIFDLVPDPNNMILNENNVSSKTISKENETFRIANGLTQIGENTLIIESNIDKNIKFKMMGGVNSAFWMSDLAERSFLEQYLPTNLEFDQYAATLEISITGKDKEHDIYTNGILQGSNNNYTIEFPEYFNTSSFFFHITPKNQFKTNEDTYQSIDGRKIPVMIYGYGSNNDYLVKTLEILSELEKDYGPWPHQKVLVYAAGRGGMEYCGATISAMNALGHELTHSYFARGVMPARGNAGWIDEAIASWRDENYPRHSKDKLQVTNMAGHSVYERKTDQAAYTSGQVFMGYLDNTFASQGGLKKFLNNYLQERLFKPYVTSNFQSDLENFFQTDLKELFDNYIYGKGGIIPFPAPIIENPNHPKLSAEELEALL